MNWKTIISISLGMITGITCLLIFNHYASTFGYLGGYILLIVFVVTPISTLIFDYKFNHKSTLNKRFLISSISTCGLIVYNTTIRLDVSKFELGALLFTFGLGILISFLVALILKY